jgi:isocitrate/isopropylmalate dehydrogenase
MLIARVRCFVVNLDFVVIRENTEGEYTGIEHEVRDASMWHREFLETMRTQL